MKIDANLPQRGLATDRAEQHPLDPLPACRATFALGSAASIC